MAGWTPHIPQPLPEWILTYVQWQLVPDEYQGYLFLAFILCAFLFILYGFYLIAIDPTFIMEPQIVLKKKGGKK